MKSVFCATAAFLLIPGAALAFATTIDYHDTHLGMTLTEFKRAKHPGLFSCRSSPEVTNCELKSDGLFPSSEDSVASYVFILHGSEMNLFTVSTSVPTERFMEVDKAMKDKYGPPTNEIEGEIDWKVGEDTIQLALPQDNIFTRAYGSSGELTFQRPSLAPIKITPRQPGPEL